MDFSSLKAQDPEIFASVKNELTRQRQNIELIASENFTDLAVMEAQGSVLTNKYAEGYPGKRWYNGCQNADAVETLAQQRICALFGAKFANVQPHSGAQANMAVCMALLEHGDTILGLDLACGGHLSHGHPMNFSGKYFKIVPYGVRKDTEQVDYAEIEKLALENKPKLIIAGGSAYPRALDFAKFREIADKVGAYLMVDMAHFAGLSVTGHYPNPVPYAHVTTSTTHKTLRGPRGGLILTNDEDLFKKINTAVFPGVQGGPLMHVIAAKAVAFKLCAEKKFKDDQAMVLKNARAMSDEFVKRGLRIVTGGTDSHLMLLDLRPINVTGKDAANVLDEIHITVNKNLLPYDSASPFITSGIRVGTPAITMRGFTEADCREVARIIVECLKNKDDHAKQAQLKKEVLALTDKYPLYPELNV
jgi:glycine hydroxymethyltransferase